MSKNPCCGPRTDGIAALRSAFSQNDSLMRVFLAATDLTSEGAICLAEYLPEVKSLIHLDLTDNLEVMTGSLLASCL
jgi:protein phosphatase 1 regulatory subunit 37